MRAGNALVHVVSIKIFKMLSCAIFIQFMKLILSLNPQIIFTPSEIKKRLKEFRTKLQKKNIFQLDCVAIEGVYKNTHLECYSHEQLIIC